MVHILQTAGILLGIGIIGAVVVLTLSVLIEVVSIALFRVFKRRA
jgi:hypothetical protein